MCGQDHAGTVVRREAVSLEVLTRWDDVAALEPCWNGLVEGSVAPNIFLTWEWVMTWRALFAARGDLRVLVVRAPGNGEPVGIAPFLVRTRPRTGPPMWRELVFMGCTPTAADHLDCISRPGWEDRVSAAVGGWLDARLRDRSWDVLRLEGMHPGTGLAKELLDRGFSGATAVWDVLCPFVPLPDRWEEFERALGRNFRANLRRRLRRLEEESGEPVSFVTVSEDEHVPAALDDLFRLHESLRQSDGVAGAFHTPLKRRFYRELARLLCARGWLRLHLLRVGRRAVAAAMCFRFGGKVWFYQTGYDRDWKRYGPGTAVIGFAIRSAIEEGAREFDMLRGDHPYKYEWNARERRVLKMQFGSTPVGGIVVPLRRSLRAAHHTWKAWRRTR